MLAGPISTLNKRQKGNRDGCKIMVDNLLLNVTNQSGRKFAQCFDNHTQPEGMSLGEIRTGLHCVP